MCSHFEALRAYEDYKKYFDVLQSEPTQGKLDMWPRYTGTFIRPADILWAEKFTYTWIELAEGQADYENIMDWGL